MNITRNKDASIVTYSTKVRKSRLLKVLAARKESQAAFARQLGCTPAHLSLVLSGKRESQTLIEKIDAFISKAA